MSVSLLHAAAHVESQGGMGAIIRRHRVREPESAFIALFEPPGADTGASRHLGATRWTTPRRLRTDFKAAAVAFPGKVAIYHNAWGVAWFAGLDGASRRVAFLHTDLPRFETLVDSLRGQVDGVICLSAAMRDVCRERLPELGPERCVVLSCPIDAPPPSLTLRPRQGPIRLGYAGRLVRAQKRLDRVMGFLAELDRRQVDWRFEFLGDGPMRRDLERQFAAEPRVSFLGWREGGTYWETLASWDAMIFFSDYEASPLALHEAMTLGVLPFFPRLGRTQGEVEAGLVGPDAVYPAGDIVGAADQVQRTFAQPEATLAGLRARAREVARVHDADRYEQAFREWIERIVALPRLSSAQARPSRIADFLPVGFLRYCWPHALLT